MQDKLFYLHILFHVHSYPLSILHLFLRGTILLVDSHNSNALERKEEGKKEQTKDVKDQRAKKKQR